MLAAIISTGDELVNGQLVDTNSTWLSEQLAQVGIGVREHISLGDDPAMLKKHLDRLAGEVDFVLATGGLGPTADDLTRFAIAELLGVELVCDTASLAKIEAIFRKFNRPMPESNRLQASFPAGCSVLANSCGTAPGIRASLRGTLLYFMPGVPSEMKAMYASGVLPELSGLVAAAGGAVIRMRTLHTMGLGESMLGEKIADLMARGSNPIVNTNAGAGIVKLRIKASAADEVTADAMIAAAEAEIRRRVGEFIWGVDTDTLPGLVMKGLLAKGKTIATVESCTGGQIAKELTDLPGSSKVFVGGWCVYSNAMKVSQIGVDAELLEQFGAVSEQVAGQLAQKGRLLAGSDYCLATTGIAGPDGGTETKPVGLVYIALAGPDGELTVEKTSFSGSRDFIRHRSVNYAFNLLRKVLTPDGRVR